MGGGSSSTKAVQMKLPVVMLQEGDKMMISGLFYEDQKQLLVKVPYNLVEPKYNALKNIYGSQSQLVRETINVVHGLVGLQNLGQTCYFNTAIHCLVHTQPLVDYFLSKLHEKEINKKNKSGTQGEVTKAFGKLLQEVWKSSRSVGVVRSSDSPQKSQTSRRLPQILDENLSPADLMKVVTKHSKMFAIGYQEDCQELLSYLLDMIHEDLNRAQKGVQIPEPDRFGEFVEEEWAAQAWENHLKANKSIIVDIFQGQTLSTLCCMKCKLQSHKFEAFLFLSLPLPKITADVAPNVQSPAISPLKKTREPKDQVITPMRVQSDSDEEKKSKIQETATQQSQQSPDNKTNVSQTKSCDFEECLQLFSQVEVLNGTSQWYCPNCKQNVDATKQLQLWKLPNVLIIHMKRFEYSEQGGKISTKVVFPIQELDLTKHVASPQKDPPLYTLYAVAQHQGNLSRGHYTAAVRNRSDSNWYWYNDHQVMQVVDIPTLIVNQFAYVLFYQKVSNEDIFRQTLSQPEKWPHLQKNNQSPIDLSQTMPARLGDMVNLDEHVIDSPFQSSNSSQRNISFTNSNENMKSPLIIGAKRNLVGRSTMIDRSSNKDFTADLSRIQNDKQKSDQFEIKSIKMTEKKFN